jgi:spore germination cell wall hydrolase CwlJ-like protein
MSGGDYALAAQDTIPLLFILPTRANARALAIAVILGLATGAALGGAYLMGGMAKAAEQHARVSRLADTAANGFSDSALARTASDEGVIAVVRRIDPALSTAQDTEDARQLAQLNDRLQRRLDRPGRPLLLRASLGGAYSPAARPFHFPGALEGSRELDCLTQAVYYEARGETPSGQAAVAQVVLNRARNAAFPKTICGVVFQRAATRSCQFSFACDGSTLRPREPGAWRRAQTIASRALDGAVMAEVGAATHFHTLNVAPMWGPRLLRVAQVGMHVFYRFGGRAGAPGAFNSEVEFASRDATDLDNATLAPTLQAATALLVSPTLVEGGVGGPASKPVEPASAPVAPAAVQAAKPMQQASDKLEVKPMQVASAS